MDAAVAHDDVRGAQAGAELGRHAEQAHARGAARRALARRRAPAADEALDEAVELVQRVQGPHQLGGYRGRGGIFILLLYIFFKPLFIQGKAIERRPSFFSRCPDYNIYIHIYRYIKNTEIQMHNRYEQSVRQPG